MDKQKIGISNVHKYTWKFKVPNTDISGPLVMSLLLVNVGGYAHYAHKYYMLYFKFALKMRRKPK